MEHEQKLFRDPIHNSDPVSQLPYPYHIQPLHVRHQYMDRGTEVSIDMGYNKTKTRNHQSRTPYHQREPIPLPLANQPHTQGTLISRITNSSFYTCYFQCINHIYLRDRKLWSEGHLKNRSQKSSDAWRGIIILMRRYDTVQILISSHLPGNLGRSTKPIEFLKVCNCTGFLQDKSIQKINQHCWRSIIGMLENYLLLFVFLLDFSHDVDRK